jgi:hypothetical protein
MLPGSSAAALAFAEANRNKPATANIAKTRRNVCKEKLPELMSILLLEIGGELHWPAIAECNRARKLNAERQENVTSH